MGIYKRVAVRTHYHTTTHTINDTQYSGREPRTKRIEPILIVAFRFCSLKHARASGFYLGSKEPGCYHDHWGLFLPCVISKLQTKRPFRSQSHRRTLELECATVANADLSHSTLWYNVQATPRMRGFVVLVV